MKQIHVVDKIYYVVHIDASDIRQRSTVAQPIAIQLRLEVYMAVSMKVAVSRSVMPCGFYLLECYAVWLLTYVSKERNASAIRVTRIGELGTALAVLLVTAYKSHMA
jgi:hypothetical protein